MYLGKKKMEGRNLEWHEEMERIGEVIGAGLGAVKVGKDPIPKTSTPGDLKSETGLTQGDREMMGSVEEKESKNTVSESEEKIVQKKSKRRKRRNRNPIHCIHWKKREGVGMRKRENPVKMKVWSM